MSNLQRFVPLAVLVCTMLALGDVPLRRANAILEAQDGAGSSTDAIVIPRIISTQGKMVDGSGIPAPDTTYSMRFGLYTQESGGSPFWTETQVIRTSSGLFTALVGSVTPIGVIPHSGNLFLGIKIASDPELIPRGRIVSDAYCFLADNSERLGGYTIDSLDIRYVGPGADYGRLNVAANLYEGSATLTDKYVNAAGDSMWGYLASRGPLRVYDKARLGAESNNPGTHAFVAGYRDTAAGSYSAVAGGEGNMVGASAPHGAIGGGQSNRIDGSHGAIAGGSQCWVGATYGVVGGGLGDTASGQCATVSGGRGNRAPYNFGAVGGGSENRADNIYASVGGGYHNWVNGHGAVAGGGYTNSVGGNMGTIGGGYSNGAGGDSATVAGGVQNSANGIGATVGGGGHNSASGNFSTVAGGFADSSKAPYSQAGGFMVKTTTQANYTLAFGELFTTYTPRAVVFYHNGAPTKLGVGVANPTHNIDVAGGAYCSGANWVNGSSRKLKEEVRSLSDADCRAILDQLLQTDVVEFKYKAEESDENHVGVIAEEAPSLLATPDRDGINTGDAIGSLIAAVKAQNAEIEELREEVRRLSEQRQ